MNKGKSLIYILAGGYLVYNAYDLFANLSDVPNAEITVVWIAIVCFALIGAAIFVIGLKDYIKISKKEKNEFQEETKEEVVSQLENDIQEEKDE